MTDKLSGCAVADVMLAINTPHLLPHLADLLRGVAPFSHTVAFGYQGAARPVALFDDFPSDKWQVFVGQYQAGPYLLDPFYLASAKPDTRGLFRIKDLAPDRFYQGEYFRNYYIQTGLAEEIGCFVDLPGGVMVVLSLMRSDRVFSVREFRSLQAVFPIVEAAIRLHWPTLSHKFSHETNDRSQPPRSPNLGQAFDNFGQSLLTPREREVVEYTLKGHSGEATGMILNIAPGTVRIHRRNIYTKLGISSQGELFARFIATLSG
jgi:DNA-binding CsgD family transcriptional regulator